MGVTAAALTTRGSGEAARRIRAVFSGYRGEQLGLRAAALTYISIFSLVPLAVVGLVLLRQLGEESFERRMEHLVLRLLSPGLAESALATLRGILTDASAKVAGGLGFAALVLAAIPLIRMLDHALNEVWNVRENRPWPVRILVWLAALIAVPLLLGTAISANTLLRRLLHESGVPFSGEILSVVATLTAIGALTLLYVVTPNCRVRWVFAFVGAGVAVLLWTVLRAGYTSFAAETFRYGVLYGSLGAIPLFLLWLYLSWFIVLAGARLAYALQNARFQSVWPALVGHPRGRELAAVRIVQHLTRAWVEQQRAPDQASLARDIELPEDVVQPILEALRDADLVHEGRHSGWSPAQDPAQLTLGQVTAALGGHGLGAPDGLDPSLPAPDLAEIDAVLVAADAEASQRLQCWTWVDLANLETRTPTPKS
ncbi:MAG TPA: YhjD/YihY/BrkB family envelope integrity protein [Myxococcaceae bacterium]|nr:YhjD/YihY/BrkB family envelope integrity protein [Myxococcaceae bacterium]